MSAGFYQPQEYPSRVLHIAGTRVWSANNGAALPARGKLGDGGEPSGYIDHGAIVSGRVDIAVEISTAAIELGRIPTAARWYMSGQKGNVKYQIQEYQPESINIAAGDGTNVPEALSGYKRVQIGGIMGPIRRLLLLDDFDQQFNVDPTQPWKQYWWTTPTAQVSNTFTRQEVGVQYVIPVDHMLLGYLSGGYSRMLEFDAVAA